MPDDSGRGGALETFALPVLRQEAGIMRDAEFDQLVRRQSRFVFRIAWAMLRNAHDAEDVVQETFLRVYKSAAWERMDNERAFLSRTAWRISVDRLKARKDEAVENDAAAADPGPERSAIASDLNSAVQRLIDKLPEDMRQPLVLSAIDGFNSREIAAVMGISEGTVRTRIMRARQILKEKLAGRRDNGHGR